MMGSHDQREDKAKSTQAKPFAVQRHEEEGDVQQHEEGGGGGDDVQAHSEGEGPVQAKVAPIMSHWADGAGAGSVQKHEDEGDVQQHEEEGDVQAHAEEGDVQQHEEEGDVQGKETVQMDGGEGEDVQHKAGKAQSPASVHAAAKAGTSGSAGSLPYMDQIQKSFGSKYDVSGLQSFQGPATDKAATQMKADAYAVGNKVAFKGTPSLHTAAHEAAHTIQQKAGAVQLAGGVGKAGDKYEQHADAVADRVVQGKPAGDLLDQMAGKGGGSSVQKHEEGDVQQNEEEGDVQGKEAVQMIGDRLDKPLAPGAEKPAWGEDAGQQRRYSVEQYEAMWEKEQGRKLTDQEKKTIDRGCIGITANNLHGGGNPPLDRAFSSFEAAHKEMGKLNAQLDKERSNPATAAQAQNKHAVVFAKMFWSNQSNDPEKRKKADPKAFKPDRNGHVDMTGYKYLAQPGYVNFDYAFWDESSQSFWHANHCQPGMHVYQSTKEKFAKGYIDFDRVIYCVAIAENYDPGLAAARHVGSAGGGQPPPGADHGGH